MPPVQEVMAASSPLRHRLRSTLKGGRHRPLRPECWHGHLHPDCHCPPARTIHQNYLSPDSRHARGSHCVCFDLSPSFVPFLPCRPAGRVNGGCSLSFPFPPLPAAPVFPHYINWFRTVLLSVRGVGSSGSRMAGNRLRSPTHSCRNAAAVSVPLAPPEPAGSSRERKIRELM